MAMFEGTRVTEGREGRAGTIIATHAKGWVTILWDDGWRGLAHISTLWYSKAQSNENKPGSEARQILRERRKRK